MHDFVSNVQDHSHTPCSYCTCIALPGPRHGRDRAHRDSRGGDVPWISCVI